MKYFPKLLIYDTYINNSFNKMIKINLSLTAIDIEKRGFQLNFYNIQQIIDNI